MSSYIDFRPSTRFGLSAALSPDGTKIAYVDDALGQFNLVVQPVAGGSARHLTSFVDHTVREVAWHPDGASLVFTADKQGDEHTQIYQVSAGGGQPQGLTDDPAVEYELPLGGPFSPDGVLMAYTANDRVPGEQDLSVRDLASGSVRRLYTGGGPAGGGFWSPDGTRLSMVRLLGTYDHVVYVAHVDGSPARQLTLDGAAWQYRLGPWLPDGSGFLVRTDSGREFVGLALMDAETGALTWLDTPDWDVEAATLSADGRVLMWTVNVDGVGRLFARDLTTGAPAQVPALPEGRPDVLAISADGRLATVHLTTPTRPWNVAVIDVQAAQLRWLTDARPASADATRLIEPSIIRYPAAESHDVPALLFRPEGGADPVGVVLSIHGGPAHQERPAYLYEGFYQYLLSCGIAVFAPNIRGSSGYGKAYQKPIYRDWGGCDLADVTAAARFLQGQRWVDSDRIGLFGPSYGGFVVLSCLGRLPEINWGAAVDFFGPSNLVTLAEATPPAYRHVALEIIGDPENERESLLSRSPITYADQIRAPLFVVQGARDRRVPQRESDQLVEKLRGRGVEVRYDIYPDEGHGFTKSDNQTRAYSDAAEFLIAHLER